MRLSNLLLSSLLQCHSSFAQVYFSQPTSEEVIMGGIPFIVTVYEPFTAPYFSQMSDFNLLLLSGNNTDPMSLYGWNLSTTNPSTVSNCIIFPPSIGPNASNSYFLGIRGTLKTNTSIYATYYSTRFTLMNMTGTQSLEPYTAGAYYTGIGGAPSLLVTCGEPTGASCNPPELKALSTVLPSYATVSAGLGLAAPIVTTPPVARAYSTSTLTASYMATTASNAGPTTTATATRLGLGSSPTSTASPSSTSASSASSKMLPAMVYPVIIAGISLTAACVLFYIYSRYRRTHHHGPKPECGKMVHERPWWDRMPMPSAMRRSRVIELDSEKAAVELEGPPPRRRGELEGDAKRVRFELEGGSPAADAVGMSERVGAPDTRLEGRVIAKVEPKAKVPSPPRNERTNAVSRAASVKRALPPLPTDQGKPGCGKVETKDCETLREALAKQKAMCHYSVGPDGAYNYR